MKKKERLPTGSKFLPHISRNKLVKMQKEETDPKAQMRLLMCIARKDGKSIRQIAREFNKSYSTTRVWLKRAIELGLKGRYDEQRPGSKPKMDKEQMKSLRKDLIAGPASGGFKSGLWTGKLLKKHIEQKYKVQYSTPGIYKVLHRAGFSRQKPRQKHPKSASKPEIKRFREMAAALIMICSAYGCKVLFEDEASFVLNSVVKSIWWPKNRKIKRVYSSLSTQRFHMFGITHEDGFDFDFYDKANAANFMKFLKKIHDKYGKCMIFLDSASYHTAACVDKFIKKQLDAEITLVPFPKYSPEENPVEPQWREIKRMIANQMFESTKEMKTVIRKMLRNGEITIVKPYEHLT